MEQGRARDTAAIDSNVVTPSHRNVVAPYADAAILIALGLLGVWDGLRVIVTKQDSFDATVSGAWVALVGAALIVLALVITVRDWRSGGLPSGAPSRPAEWPDGQNALSNLAPPLLVLVLMITFALLLTRGGYMLCTAAFMAAYVGRFGHYRWLYVVLGSALFAVATAFLFAKLKVQLPHGFLPWP